MKDPIVSISYIRDILEKSYKNAVDKGVTMVGIPTCDLEILVKALKVMEKELDVLQIAARIELHELCKYPDVLIATALSYAYNMHEHGVDVTEKYDTACKNAKLITDAYNKGYYACLKEIRRRQQEAEHEHNDSE